MKLLVSFQVARVTDAAWGCDWVGTPVPFQRCLAFIIATANKEFTLTAGKFVPVSNKTMMNVRGIIVNYILRTNSNSENKLDNNSVHVSHNVF
jgi:hypothetical protein